MITLRCKHCPQLFTSLLIIPEDAITQVSTDFTRHLVASHREEHKQALLTHQKFAALSVWLVLFCNHTDIMNDERIEEDDNKLMFEQVGKVLAQLGEFIGQDLTIEDEGDTDDDTDDDDSEDGYEVPELESTNQSVPILPNLKLDIN